MLFCVPLAASFQANKAEQGQRAAACSCCRRMRKGQPSWEGLHTACLHRETQTCPHSFHTMERQQQGNQAGHCCRHSLQVGSSSLRLAWLL